MGDDSWHMSHHESWVMSHESWVMSHASSLVYTHPNANSTYQIGSPHSRTLQTPTHPISFLISLWWVAFNKHPLQLAWQTATNIATHGGTLRRTPTHIATHCNMIFGCSFYKHTLSPSPYIHQLLENPGLVREVWSQVFPRSTLVVHRSLP